MTHHADLPVFGEHGEVPVPAPSHLSSAQFHVTNPVPQHTPPALPPQPVAHRADPDKAAHFGVDNAEHLAPYRVGNRTTADHSTSVSAAGLYPYNSHTMGSLWDFSRTKGE